MPKFLPFPVQGLTLRTSSPSVQADLNADGDMYLLLQTERAPHQSRCYVYVYADHFASALMATCQVEVCALQCLRLKVPCGVESLYQLQVRSEVKRTIEVYADKPRVVYPPGKKERNIQIVQSGETSQLNVAVKTIQGGVQRIRLHCVDINTKELVQAWLLELESDKPLL